MFGKIVTYGTIGGLIVGLPQLGLAMVMKNHPPLAYGLLIGYTTMLIALSTVFIAIKRHRDIDLGGVIKFWPAFGLGLGISFVASVFYVLAWEATQALTHMDFANGYAKLIIAQAKAKGASGAALAKVVADMQAFKTQYANPFYRLPMTFTEIFPVGVLVSLISAALLRSSPFLPAIRR